MSFNIYIQTPIDFPFEPRVIIDVEAVEVTDEETDNNQTDNKE